MKFYISTFIVLFSLACLSATRINSPIIIVPVGLPDLPLSEATNVVAIGDVTTWYGVACSSNGLKVYAVAQGGSGTGRAHSDDGGLTWISDGVGNWYTVGCSADGQTAMQMAYANAVGIQYTGTGGSSWIDIGRGAGWHDALMSGDGEMMGGIVENYRTVWSTNLFATEISRINIVAAWAVSYDHQKLIACQNSATGYYSTNGAVTWNLQKTVGGDDYGTQQYGMDASGGKLALCSYKGGGSEAFVYTGTLTPSNNPAVVWTKTSAPATNRNMLVMSGDGNTIVTAAWKDASTEVEISRDGGASWGRLSLPGASTYLYKAAISYDGSVIYICSQQAGRQIYKITIGVPVSPVVTVRAATVYAGGAALNGYLSSDGNATCQTYFCWATNDCGTTLGAWPNVVSSGDAISGQSISATTTVLTTGVTYWCRSYAVNLAGNAWSSPTNFVQSSSDPNHFYSTNYVENFTNYTAIIFTNGTSVWITSSRTADVLVVAGGGSGGAGARGAGGGAGGYRYITTNLNATSYSIVVGGGGRLNTAYSSVNTANVSGSNGLDSIFGSITSIGGGGGAGGDNNSNGKSGGSGGGAWYAGSAGICISGQGNNGGTAGTGAPAYGGGGGGGAGGVGGNGSSTVPGDGGLGITNRVSGISVVYSAGGSGANYNSATHGTHDSNAGGGNNTSPTHQAGTDAVDATGCGGGSGGNGGSGIVIVRVVRP